MKNPLYKRLPRELKTDFGKYLLIFLFMTLTIGFVSGFLVADGSMTASYNSAFKKYNIEYGNFETKTALTDTQRTELEKHGVTVYNNNYTEKTVTKPGSTQGRGTLRVFNNRQNVNKVCLLQGSFPQNKEELAIDRLYAKNNGIQIGDTILFGGDKRKVTGIVALPDYSALFSNNSDLMFDSVKFGVAVTSKDGLNAYADSQLHFSNSWLYHQKPTDDTQEKAKADAFLKDLGKTCQIQNYIPRYENQAIQFSGNDLGSDRSMYLVLLYILIAIMAFVFAVTTSNTISKEANIIGTLRASGYTKGEVVWHYLATPLAVTVLAALLGNVLGYTVFKGMVANLYCGSYSLTTYETQWNSEAFLLTTAVPFVITFFVNLIAVIRKMSFSPLQFLRRDLTKHHRQKAVRLPNFKFFRRFRLRVLAQNLPNYVTLLLGICFASVLLMFGTMLTPLFHHYQDEVVNNQLSKYQYVLKAPVETKQSAEKYSMTSLKTTFGSKKDGEDISVYGMNNDSKYLHTRLNKDTVLVSNGFAAKYDLQSGDTIKLKEAYSNKTYTFKITGTYSYPAALSVFMSQADFNKKFDKKADDYTGYLSNEKLTDISNDYIAATITKDDFTKLTRQMQATMGNIFVLYNGFCVALYIVLIFLLAKVVIEKNTNSISMVKILGYKNSEARKLYLNPTRTAAVISMLVGLPVAALLIKKLFKIMMQSYNGWLTLYIAPTVYVEMLVIGLVSYLIVELILYRKIKHIPMDEALKNVE